MQAKTVYDKIIDESGVVYASSSQGQELRDTRQVYRQKGKESLKKEPHNDLYNVIRLQSQSRKIIRTISITGKIYQVFLSKDVQLQDVELFCCDNNGVSSVDTTFNFVTAESLALVTTTKGW